MADSTEEQRRKWRESKARNSEKLKNDPYRKALDCEKSRRYYYENKDRLNAKRNKRRQENAKEEQARWREWYYKNWKHARATEIERRRLRNPLGLGDTLSQFRSGAIGVDELNRRYDEAIKRADEIVSRTGKGK